ncbi:MAG: sulfate ABC transporter substrate-binding protein [Coriobacteriia bacterium]
MRSVNTGRRRRAAGVALAVLLAVALSGCVRAASSPSGAGQASKARQLTLVAFSIPEKAYKEIIPAFQEHWRNETGETVEFTVSYGGSSSQARAVVDGLEADVVHLAMEPDVERIVEAGLIEAGWQARFGGTGVPTTSLIVIGVRPGNPKSIDRWADVSQRGIWVVTPNPKTSGGAQWNLLAAWGSVTVVEGGSEDEAYEQVRSLYASTLVLDKNARDASNTFLLKGIGDVAVLWESDALIAQSEGAELEVVVPRDTILAETAVAVVDSNAKKSGNEDVAKEFVAFLFTPESQRAFAEAGMRPVDQKVLAEYEQTYPLPEGRLFTIADLGGWSRVTPEFFGEGGIYSRIEADVAAER